MSDNIQRASICTFTGKQFFLLEPVIEDIDIRDIAHSLALQCRWTGHSKFHYSVGQHSYYCSLIVPKKDALYALLHDSAETYLSDISRPLKHHTQVGVAYMLQERLIQNAIKQRFDLPSKEPKSIHIADNQMLYAERDQLMTGWQGWWNEDLEMHKNFGPANITIKPWSPAYAEKMFLKRFKKLYRGKA